MAFSHIVGLKASIMRGAILALLAVAAAWVGIAVVSADDCHSSTGHRIYSGDCYGLNDRSTETPTQPAPYSTLEKVGGALDIASLTGGPALFIGTFTPMGTGSAAFGASVGATAAATDAVNFFAEQRRRLPSCRYEMWGVWGPPVRVCD